MPIIRKTGAKKVDSKILMKRKQKRLSPLHLEKRIERTRLFERITNQLKPVFDEYTVPYNAD